MRRLFSFVLGCIAMITISSITSVSVKADSSLSTLTVVEKNNNGETREIALSPAFSPEITEYSATAMSDSIALEVTASVTEEGAVYDTDWLALDPGDNKSYIYVTDASGNKTTYTINTKKLTAEEQETYVPEQPSGQDDDIELDEEPTAEFDGFVMNVGSFADEDIPEGFEKITYDYNGIEVPAIKGTTKKLVALWLEATDERVGDEELTTESEEQTEEVEIPKSGFYIFREKKNDFYPMKNVYIKSRMYTVIKKGKIDKFLKPYDKATVVIGGTEFEAWVLDQENQLYLVYAMNWNGETNLYCYDDIEKCFQRYIVASAADTLLQQANTKLQDLQNDYNTLAQKYNRSNSIKWKAIGGLGVIIVILFFICLNLWLSLSRNKILKEEDDDGDYYYDYKPKKKSKSENKRKKAPKKPKKKKEDYYSDYEEFEEDEDYDEEDDDDNDDELFELVDDKNENLDDDFVIFNNKDKHQTRPIKPVVEHRKASHEAEERKQREKKLEDDSQRMKTAPFDIDLGEIDISDQVKKEFESLGKGKIETPKQVEEEDDDGFTFI
ncbi:MAG: cadherin-like beta sandwich domain-containing protein [Lachnospiraceae bacterium]|nr:cadherin-like beta sandwich domain-containing protein [Lachnospiraceae bacterium]